MGLGILNPGCRCKSAAGVCGGAWCLCGSWWGLPNPANSQDTIWIENTPTVFRFGLPFYYQGWQTAKKRAALVELLTGVARPAYASFAVEAVELSCGIDGSRQLRFDYTDSEGNTDNDTISLAFPASTGVLNLRGQVLPIEAAADVPDMQVVGDDPGVIFATTVPASVSVSYSGTCDDVTFSALNLAPFRYAAALYPQGTGGIVFEHFESQVLIPKKRRFDLFGNATSSRSRLIGVRHKTHFLRLY